MLNCDNSEYREHRRIIMTYLKSSSPRTQVERTLALLVESGIMYCIFWVRPIVPENRVLLTGPYVT